MQDQIDIEDLITAAHNLFQDYLDFTRIYRKQSDITLVTNLYNDIYDYIGRKYPLISRSRVMSHDPTDHVCFVQLCGNNDLMYHSYNCFHITPRACKDVDIAYCFRVEHGTLITKDHKIGNCPHTIYQQNKQKSKGDENA